MSGVFNEDNGDGLFGDALDYYLYGVDCLLHDGDLWRLQTEYAYRKTDVITSGLDAHIAAENVDGFYAEGELRILEKPRISAVIRYDQMNHDCNMPISKSEITENKFGILRMTWGTNTALSGGSTLLFNYEQWQMPDALEDVDVFGVRWITYF